MPVIKRYTILRRTARGPFTTPLAVLLLAFGVLSGCGVAQHKPAGQPAPEEIAGQALSYLRAGRTQAALDLLGQGLHAHPKSSTLWKTLGLTLARVDKNRQADRAFRHALRLAPNNGGVHNDYGVFLCREQLYDQARGEFKAAIDNPGYDTPQFAWTNLGICALRQGKKDVARRGFTQALTRAPDFAPALYQMAKLEAAHDRPRQATTYLRRLRHSGTQTPQSLSLCMKVYKDIDDFKQASDCARQLYRQFPDSAEAHALTQ